MVRVAKKLAVKKSRAQTHRHAALIIAHGRIIAAGWNHGVTHAEADALRRAGDVPGGAEMLCVRVRRNGSLGMAKPCAKCMNSLLENGFRWVSYTDEWGAVVRQKVGTRAWQVVY